MFFASRSASDIGLVCEKAGKEGHIMNDYEAIGLYAAFALIVLSI